MKDLLRLPDSELTVMQSVWEHPAPVTRADIEKDMQSVHPMAQTTLLTLLSRLTDKGFVALEKVGRMSVYTPLVSKRDYLAAEGNRFFKKLCSGSMNSFAAALCDSGLSREDIEELRALLERGEI